MEFFNFMVTIFPFVSVFPFTVFESKAQHNFLREKGCDSPISSKCLCYLRKIAEMLEYPNLEFTKNTEPLLYISSKKFTSTA
jgi:hypothetical protein